MTDETANLLLEAMRRMERKLDLVLDKVRELRIRVTAVDVHLGIMNSRLDRLDERVDRIERRLGLVEG